MRLPSPSLVISIVALCVALGGTSYAVVKLPKNSVGGAQLRANAVDSGKVRDRSLRAKDFALGQLPAGAQGPAGATGPAGERGPQGERGPSEAYLARGSAPIGLVPGAGVEVAAISVPAGAYTVTATGFVYANDAGPNDGRDQIVCTVFDAADHAVAGMPSQVTLSAPTQFLVLGAGDAVAGKLRLTCSQIAVGAADSAFTEINAKIVATRVGSVTAP